MTRTTPSEEVGSVTWMTAILAKLRKHPDAQPFLKPVDWKRLGLDDYLAVVAQPMDLQTVGRQCRDGCYTSLESFQKDIALIWENCRTYNGPTSEISSMANRMEAFAAELFAAEPAAPAPAAAVPMAEPSNEEELTKSKRRRRAADESAEARSARARPPRPASPSPARMRAVQKLCARLARLNSTNLHQLLLSAVQEEWIAEKNGGRWLLDLRLIEDRTLSALLSVSKCLLFHQMLTT